MRAQGVVDFFPVPQHAIELFHFQRAGRDWVELLGVGAVGAFGGAIEFGRARGKHEQVQTALLAILFELGGELASTIDRQRANGERHAVLQGIRSIALLEKLCHVGSRRGFARIAGQTQALHHQSKCVLMLVQLR